GEQIREIGAVQRKSREESDRDRRKKKPNGQRYSHAESGDAQSGNVRRDHHGSRERDERRAGLHGRVAEDVLQVKRQEEELRERGRSDDGQHGVRGGQRAQAEETKREERRLRARLALEEGRDKRWGVGEKTGV